MNFLDKLAPHAHWALRISLASVFLYHGIGKFPNVDGFAQMFGLPGVVAWLVAIGEVAAGVMLLIGKFTSDLITRLGALLAIVILLGAIYLVHWANGWSFVNNGMEFQVTMLLIGIYMLIKGNDM